MGDKKFKTTVVYCLLSSFFIVIPAGFLFLHLRFLSLCRPWSVWPLSTHRSLSEMRASPSTTWRWQHTVAWVLRIWIFTTHIVHQLDIVNHKWSPFVESVSESFFIVVHACRMTVLYSFWVSVMRVASVCRGMWEQPQNTTNELPKQAISRPSSC